ncbi:DUF3486 family protein [Kluyvera cryocrescens]|uniref:DUF3486 family protein n=2 Tax=root TaxID=1 RepID=A0ABR6RTG1_9ENTR|nr:MULTISPECIES: DUF3486 family protein [Enterobacteriaceae]ELZ5050511.1 DUF3486 family protein [Enterobacter asburiae]QLO47720.1 DUF3486 family protein [Enterobacter cloacae]DAD98483.1 MAG TPA: Protein of unknown function (DUF3486) [Myoviridae sp. ctrMq22]ESL80425.1 hypothetical protein L423_02584 [Enterobacter roggenkampii]MBC1186417.1 DUF3486 family protein [Kluyvera sichuanensis]
METTKPTRGRASKVDLLPEDVKKTLHAMLRDKAIPQAQILEEINALIDDAGLPEDMRLSRSGLNRYATSVEQVGQNLRQMREMTQALTSQLGDKPMGETTKLILEMARSQLFKALMRQIEDPEAEVDIDMLKNAMLAAQRLESTAMSSHKREKEIRQAFAEEAANAVSDELRGTDGMSEELEQRIRNVLLGKA